MFFLTIPRTGTSNFQWKLSSRDWIWAQTTSSQHKCGTTFMQNCRTFPRVEMIGCRVKPKFTLYKNKKVNFYNIRFLD